MLRNDSRVLGNNIAFVLPVFLHMLRFNTNYFSNFQVMTYLEDSEWVKVTLSRLLKGVDFSGGAVVKNLPASAEDTRDEGLIPGSGRPPGVGNGNPLQYSCLENPMDRGAWQATVHRVAQSWTRLKWLSRHIITYWLKFICWHIDQCPVCLSLSLLTPC